MSWWRRIKYALQTIFFGTLIVFGLGPASVPLNDPAEMFRRYTRTIEFDYVEWTIEAITTKLEYATLGLADYLDRDEQRQVVFDLLDLIWQIQTLEYQMTTIYSDPTIEDPEAAASTLREQLDTLYRQRDELQPVAEAVIQQMVSEVVDRMGLDFLGQPLPQVMFESTPLPWALIISPRDVIRADADISLEVDLTVEDHIRLEDRISREQDVSTLVVPVGGIGTYPTMIAQTTNLNWLMEVVSHEWIHNYLSLNPLGMRYEQSPEMRTINETAASLAGKELGAAVIAEFFPEFVPPPPAPPSEVTSAEPPEQAAPVFDFQVEMHETRVNVDAMLADGNIDGAEAYLEARRVFFWNHGYHIRKLNQAYFAFYGAYADSPVGSAGEDPVGAAVRELRAHSTSLGEFIRMIAEVKSFDQLLELVGEPGAGG